MFAAPPEIKSEVFTRIPDSLRIKDRSSKWVEFQRLGAPTDSFLEGPSFDREGNLWVVDIPWGRIFKISPEGKVTVAAEYDGEPNGLKFHKDGQAFIADHKNGIMVLDPHTGKVTPYLNRAWLQRFKGLNDLLFASNGDLWFTDQGQTGLQDPTGCLYRLRTDGQLDRILNNVPSPNGLVMNLAENMMYLAVTRTNAVWRIPLMKDGTASKVGVHIQLSGGSGGPDGLAIDTDGNLAICHPGLGTVWIMNGFGEPLFRIKSCSGLATTNIAYGGSENKTLYITESGTGTILKAELPVAGRTMFSHMD